MKIYNIIIAIIFIIFAALQFNDPNPLKWIVVYGLAAVLSVFAAANRTIRMGNIGMIIVCSIWLLSCTPEIIEILSTGNLPIDSNSGHLTKVKYFNEFGGLLLLIFALGFQLYRSEPSRTD